MHLVPPVSATSAVPTAAALQAAFDAPAPLTVGLEEELMLLEPASLDLAPRAPEALAALGGDPRFKLELPAAQLEIVTRPGARVGDVIAELASARRAAAARLAGRLRLAAAGLHPFAEPVGAINPGERYERIAADYGQVARRQLVFGLQVHVAVRPAARALAVYNALRGHLPDLAALAANAPFHAGGDTGLASARPLVSGLLPRQGVPPALASWDAYAEALRWGAAAGALPSPTQWWWELRPHPLLGTLELRVPDAQATVEDAAAVAAVAHALVGWLAARHDAGEALPAAPSWRIAENRWSACRHGLEGAMADLVTGEREPTRERLHRLLDDLAPHAAALGCAPELARARALVDEGGGAGRQRRLAAERGLPGLVAALADAYAPGA